MNGDDEPLAVGAAALPAAADAARPRPAVVRDALRYSICGAGAGLTDYTTFLLLTHAAGWSPVGGQALSRPAGGLVSFAANRLWTFRHRRGHAVHVQFLRYWTVWAVCYGLALAALEFYLWVLPDNCPRLAAKVCADSTLGIITFLLQRHWTFMEKEDSAPA